MDASKKIKWGILGCAGIADQHMIAAIQDTTSSELLAIASRSLEKARSFANKYNITNYYGNYDELLADAEIEAVYIPLPNHLHCQWVEKADSAGKHVLCEKPFALNEAEAQRMVKACRSANVILAEAFMYRHHPRYERALEIIRSGQIGNIRGMTGHFTFDLSHLHGDIRFQSNMGGGSIYDDGCYPISAARLLLGAEPEAVTAHSMFSSEHDGVDMMNTVLLDFPGGVGAMLQFGMWCAGRNEITVLGSKGSITIPDAFYYEPPSTTLIVLQVDGKKVEERFESLNHYILQVNDFNKRIVRAHPQADEFDEILNNMKVIEAVLKSSRERARVPLI